jgi:polar amino acid transport system substrate-binding protein
VTAPNGSAPRPAPGASPRRWGRIVAVVVVLAALAVMLAPRAFPRADVPEALPGPTSTTAPDPAPPAAATDCGDPTASLRPTGPATTAVAPESYMGTIQARGRLRVGVSATNLLFSTVDPITGDFEGFDVDIAREVARALFGDPDRVEFVVVAQTDRVAVLQEGTVDQQGTLDTVDMVASTFSITCDRQEAIDFSTEYFTSGQRLLVPAEDAAAGVTMDTLAADGARVCAAEGSTSIGVLRDWEPELDTVAPPTHAECLALLQQGEVDAVSTDDTLLAGFKAQDPNVEIVGGRLTTEPYGLGLPPGQDEWVRYVNAVLEDLRSSGRWDEIYARWLSGALGVQQAPAAVYSG